MSGKRYRMFPRLHRWRHLLLLCWLLTGWSTGLAASDAPFAPLWARFVVFAALTVELACVYTTGPVE